MVFIMDCKNQSGLLWIVRRIDQSVLVIFWDIGQQGKTHIFLVYDQSG